jgi:hypothetical protein
MFSHTIRQTSTMHGPPSRSADLLVAAPGELDVEAAQVGGLVRLVAVGIEVRILSEPASDRCVYVIVE